MIGRPIHRDETCASHMPVLMEFIARFKPQRVLELGCGYYSSRLFLDRCSDVVSIESDSAEWFTTMEACFAGHPNWRHVHVAGLDNVRCFMDQAGMFDLIFVDGGIYRAEETNHAFQYAPTVIGHDTQGWWAQDGKSLVQQKYTVPMSVRQIDFTHFPVGYGGCAGCDDRPWTTLFTRREDVAAHFRDIEASLYERYEFPYVYEKCPNITCVCKKENQL